MRTVSSEVGMWERFMCFWKSKYTFLAWNRVARGSVSPVLTTVHFADVLKDGSCVKSKWLIIGPSGKHYGSPKFSKEFRGRKLSLKELRDVGLCCTQDIRWQEEELTLTRGSWKRACLGKDRPAKLLVRMWAGWEGGRESLENFELCINEAGFQRGNILGKTGRERGWSRAKY